MLEDTYPVRWAGRQAVVALPEHIDVSNAGQIREELLSVINRGAGELIVDMTATVSCDQAGAEAVVRAYRRAVVSGTELRLVVTAQIVSRVLSLSGLDQLVSIYPSVEAAMAASASAAVLTLVSAATRTGTDGQASPRHAEQDGARFLAVRAFDGNGADPDPAPAVAWKLLDALQDGVALAGEDGTVALANARLQEMFGYESNELLGLGIESLVPDGLRAVHRGHRASYTREPRVRPMGAGTTLVALRKDGSTFPAEISLSPVTTAAGRFALTVIRDVTEARRVDELADLARAAVRAEQAQQSRDLHDRVVTSLFQAGLSLRAALNGSAEDSGQRITEVLGQLGHVIREIRSAEFSVAHGQDDPPAQHP